MNLKSLTLSAMIVGLVAPMAQAFTVVPANYVSGVVDAVDANRGTITVDGTAYAVAPTMLTDVAAGGEVTLTLVAMKPVAIDPIVVETDEEIIE